MPQKILIVDDEPTSVQLTKRRLEAAGYLIHEALNGQDALGVLDREPIDLIITDIMMPVMDGVDLYKAIKKSSRTVKIPIIIITQSPTIQESFRALGVNEFIAKPLDANKMLEKVQTVLAVAPKNFAGGKALVIGSKSSLITEMAMLLEREGTKAVACDEGAAAIQKALIQVPDVVLIDVLLKDLSAKEVIKALRCFVKLEHIKFCVYNSILPNDIITDDIIKFIEDEQKACAHLGAEYIGRINKFTFLAKLRQRLALV